MSDETRTMRQPTPTENLAGRALAAWALQQEAFRRGIRQPVQHGEVMFFDPPESTDFPVVKP